MLKNPEVVAEFSVTRSVTQSWSGPLPDPDTLAKFNDVEPGTAGRIIRMAETEGEHARSLDSRIVNAAIVAEFFGLFCGLAISLVAFYCAYKLAMAHHDWVAAALVGGGLVSLVGTFIRRESKQDKKDDKEEKAVKKQH